MIKGNITLTDNKRPIKCYVIINLIKEKYGIDDTTHIIKITGHNWTDNTMQFTAEPKTSNEIIFSFAY